MKTETVIPAAAASPGGRIPGGRIGFRGRLLLFITGLLFLSQTAVMLAVLNTTGSNALTRAQDELTVGARVFEELLFSRETQLLTSARVLSSDFGFKEAVATEDLGTIVSALTNSGARIGADTALLLSTNGEITAATRDMTAGQQQMPLAELLAAAQSQGEASGQVILGGRPYQLVLVPVNAPALIAWAAMGFLLDDRLAEDLQNLTGLEVSFESSIGGGQQPDAPHYLASTLDETDRADLLARLGEDSGELNGGTISLPGGEYFSTRLVLFDQDEQRITALLQTSRAAAMQSFIALRDQLLLIGGMMLMLSILMGVFIARGVTRPINILADAARRITSGVYDRPVLRQTNDELGMLADSFNQMQAGIAQREDRILHQSFHDTLTGLPNRNNAQHQLQQMLLNESDRPFTLILFDIARFKQINDTLGHAIGDQVLRLLGIRFHEVIKNRGFAARVGGNEFLVVLKDQDHTRALRNTRNLLEAMSVPVPVDNASIPIKMNAGITVYPDNGDSAETLLRRANIALYAAKNESSEQPLLYRDGEDERHLHQLRLLHDLREAIDAGQLELAYQPKVTIATGELAGVEALVRWNHPELGRIPPDSFIPLAEQSGLIQQLTYWVLKTALHACRDWQTEGLEIPVAVNLSGLDVLNPGLAETIHACLSDVGLPARLLMLEVTESMLMQDADRARIQLEELRGLGTKISIDDFGTGYSSLAQLRQLPVDQLKIDRTFVMPMEQDQENVTIVRTIVQLGHSFNLEVVAEGVENLAIMHLLRDLGCDTAQGFGLGRPMPAEAIPGWLVQWRQLQQDGNRQTTTRNLTGR